MVCHTHCHSCTELNSVQTPEGIYMKLPKDITLQLYIDSLFQGNDNGELKMTVMVMVDN